MTQTQALYHGQPRSWACPVEPSRYDRSPNLTMLEQQTLRELTAHATTTGIRWTAQRRAALARLLEPFNDTLTMSGAEGAVRASVIALLMGEMHQRQATMWGWTRADWRDIIGYNRWAFQQRHKRQPDVRGHLIALTYVLHDYTDVHLSCRVDQLALAHRVFGPAVIDAAVDQIIAELRRWGHGEYRLRTHILPALCALFLLNRSPYLEALSDHVFTMARNSHLAKYLKVTLVPISRVLHSFGMLAQPLTPDVKADERFGNHDARANIAPEWVAWCGRWATTSTLAPKTRQGMYYQLLKVGRWLTQTHPDIVSPTQWNRELAAAYVAAVGQSTVGQWANAEKMHGHKLDQPLSARAKMHLLSALRTFFQNCQEWTWLPRHFDPRRALATPRTIRAHITTNPRVIADDIWAKLLWAGLNLTRSDLPLASNAKAAETHPTLWYPVEMVRAVAVVWLFAGLRSDEIYRLRLGCVRWQRDDVHLVGTR